MRQEKIEKQIMSLVERKKTIYAGTVFIPRKTPAEIGKFLRKMYVEGKLDRRQLKNNRYYQYEYFLPVKHEEDGN